MEEQIDYKGYQISIQRDYNSMNPIKDWDVIGEWAFFHRRYDLGNTKRSLSEFREWLAGLAAKEKEKFIFFPVYMYEHSGITLSLDPFSCQWDSGRLGTIVVSYDEILKEYGNPGAKVVTKKMKDTLRKYMEGMIETYNDYLCGNVYGYDVTDRDGESIDSCWGYIGDPEKSGLLDDAKSNIDYKVTRDYPLLDGMGLEEFVKKDLV